MNIAHKVNEGSENSQNRFVIFDKRLIAFFWYVLSSLYKKVYLSMTQLYHMPKDDWKLIEYQ